MRTSLCALAVVALAGCGTQPAARPSRLLARLPQVAALAVRPDGALLIGERLSGRVLEEDVASRTSRVIARLPVSTRGQRGLLGLAVKGRRTFAAYTTPASRLVVAELAEGAVPRLVWRGPRSALLANGGHLDFAPGGRLVIGIGDRQGPSRSGRMLALDPDGAPGQRPLVLSHGWNNPFAFAYVAGDGLWVADNSPGKAPERLARGDRRTPRAVTVLPAKTAPSALVALGHDELALCGFVSGTLDRYVRDGDAWRRDGVIARGCTSAAARLRNGDIVFATADGLRTVTP